MTVESTANRLTAENWNSFVCLVTSTALHVAALRCTDAVRRRKFANSLWLCVSAMLSFGLAELRATTPLGRTWLAIAALAGWILLALVFALVQTSLQLSHAERAHSTHLWVDQHRPGFTDRHCSAQLAQFCIQIPSVSCRRMPRCAVMSCAAIVAKPHSVRASRTAHIRPICFVR
jgi:hypothetical protein